MRKLENRYFARFFLLVLRSVKNNIINSHCESPPWRGRSNLKSLRTKRLHGRVLGLRRSTPCNDIMKAPPEAVLYYCRWINFKPEAHYGEYSI